MNILFITIASQNLILPSPKVRVILLTESNNAFT
jgi:hypothetical protein